MDDTLRVASERIERFKKMGGVDLSKLFPEEKHDLSAEIRCGIASYKKVIFHFRCPVCSHQVASDMEMEPMCTGPSWTDDHPPEIMVAIPDSRRI